MPEPLPVGVAGGERAANLAIRARILFHAGRAEEAGQALAGAYEAVGDGADYPQIPGLPSHLDDALALADRSLLERMEADLARSSAPGLMPFSIGLWTRRLAEVLRLLGRDDEAEPLYERALETAERERLPIEEGRCHQALADFAEARGDLAAARAHLDTAAALYARYGIKLYLDQVLAKKGLLGA